jgi:hypothetical protein
MTAKNAYSARSVCIAFCTSVIARVLFIAGFTLETYILRKQFISCDKEDAFQKEEEDVLKYTSILYDGSNLDRRRHFIRKLN